MPHLVSLTRNRAVQPTSWIGQRLNRLGSLAQPCPARLVTSHRWNFQATPKPLTLRLTAKRTHPGFSPTVLLGWLGALIRLPLLSPKRSPNAIPVSTLAAMHGPGFAECEKVLRRIRKMNRRDACRQACFPLKYAGCHLPPI